MYTDTDAPPNCVAGADTSLSPQSRKHKSDRLAPVLDDSAFHGLAGKYVREIAPNTEADPVAMLLMTLAWCGSVMGNGLYLARGSRERHPASIWPLLVGKTAVGRKGTAETETIGVLTSLSSQPRKRSGLSSGEGLIEAFISDDPEVQLDQRLLIVESEWESVLARIKKEGNSLSEILRDAFDGKPLSTMTVKDREVTQYHLTVVGHITPRAVSMATSEVDIANGFLNRFLCVEVQRPHLIDWPDDHGPLVGVLAQNLVDASISVPSGEWKASLDARDLYREWYVETEKWRELQPERVADALARGSANLLRLSLIYAALDGSNDRKVELEHMNAAKAVIDYSATSTYRVFGPGRAGNDRKILEALGSAPDGEMTRVDLHRKVFQNHITKQDLDAALSSLAIGGHIITITQKTEGRDASIIRLT